jgi:hypothetical protein
MVTQGELNIQGLLQDAATDLRVREFIAYAKARSEAQEARRKMFQLESLDGFQLETDQPAMVGLDRRSDRLTPEELIARHHRTEALRSYYREESAPHEPLVFGVEEGFVC